MADANSTGNKHLKKAVRANDWNQDNDDWNQDDDDWRMSRIVAVPSALERPTIPGRRMVTMGWHPDLPDYRDYCIRQRKDSQSKATCGNNKVVEWLNEKKSSILKTSSELKSCHYDNIKYCSPVEDQGQIGSCTAQAVVGLMEYNMCRANSEHIDGSRLFVYKITRKLMGVVGDQGGYLRTAMEAVSAFGIPPEQYYPYDESRFDEEPSPFAYTYATNFKAVKYARLDGLGLDGGEVLDDLKRTLAAGHCAVFGFPVFSSLSRNADIPFPGTRDVVEGGHAVMAVGYDNNRKNIGTEEDGAIVIRNSWGREWGILGYGFLPYEYFRLGLARDCWSVFAWDWLNTGKFDVNTTASPSVPE